MRKTQVLVGLIALLIGGFVGSKLTYLLQNTAYAQQAGQQAQEVNSRWEYCLITLEMFASQEEGTIRNRAVIRYLQPTGYKSESVEVTTKTSFQLEADRAALGRATAKLGLEGWEMIGELAQQRGIYLKRRQKQ